VKSKTKFSSDLEKEASK